MSVATGVLKPVLGKLAALLGEEYKRFKGVHGDIRFLIDELAAMHAFLLKMSEEEDLDLQEKVWMTAVRELSYGMEDCIDDFMEHVNDKVIKPDGLIENIKTSLWKLGKLKARRRIGNVIQDMKKQTIEVGDRNERYKTRDASFSTINFSRIVKAAVDPRALSMFEHASKLVGIDQPKADIIKLLTERGSTKEQPKLVSIVGFGGMGKTTLANQVFQDLKGKFQCRAFLSVSRNPDMMNILRTIFSEVSGQDYSNTKAGSIQQLIGRILDFLTDRRYFVVVDDIWDMDTWCIIKLVFPMTSSGSIIITTTRINDVAESCRSSFGGEIYNISPLTMVHSRELFRRRLFDSKEDLPSHLEKVSCEILKKCDGLPLAIIAICGLLANKERREDVWNQVKDSIGRALERNPSVERMMKILSLSYFDLPPHLKTCLLYLSIFPEDSLIMKKGLIWRWIGEGIIHTDDRYTVYELGEMCFNELINRSLIQPFKTGKFGKVKGCRVHDTILDFLISKSIEENFLTLVGVPIPTIRTQSKVVRRLSLQVGDQGSSTMRTGLVLSHVRSLNMFRNSLNMRTLKEFTHLRVLDLKSCSNLDEHHLDNIASLFHLRYLNLQSTRINELPEKIGRLGCLEMLDLRGTNVLELPASIVNLTKLSRLLVSNLVKFPNGIAKMQALETLKQVSVSNQPYEFLWGLGQLTNLRNLVLVLPHPEADSDNKDTNVVGEDYNKDILSSLCKLGTKNLSSMTIWNGSSLLLEDLCLLNLKKLISCSSTVQRVPKWVKSLRNLQELRLELEGVKQDDLCILGALPTLLILHLKEAKQSNEKLRISGEVGFLFLRNFFYMAEFHPVDLMFVAGSMPKLERLELNSWFAVQLECLDFGIKNLPCLITVECEVDGNCGILEAIETAMERAASTHPNHPTLFFKKLDIGSYLHQRVDFEQTRKVIFDEWSEGPGSPLEGR